MCAKQGILDRPGLKAARHIYSPAVRWRGGPENGLACSTWRHVDRQTGRMEGILQPRADRGHWGS